MSKRLWRKSGVPEGTPNETFGSFQLQSQALSPRTLNTERRDGISIGTRRVSVTKEPEDTQRSFSVSEETLTQSEASPQIPTPKPYVRSSTFSFVDKTSSNILSRYVSPQSLLSTLKPVVENSSHFSPNSQKREQKTEKILSTQLHSSSPSIVSSKKNESISLTSLPLHHRALQSATRSVLNESKKSRRLTTLSRTEIHREEKEFVIKKERLTTTEITIDPKTFKCDSIHKMPPSYDSLWKRLEEVETHQPPPPSLSISLRKITNPTFKSETIASIAMSMDDKKIEHKRQIDNDQETDPEHLKTLEKEIEVQLVQRLNDSVRLSQKDVKGNEIKKDTEIEKEKVKVKEKEKEKETQKINNNDKEKNETKKEERDKIEHQQNRIRSDYQHQSNNSYQNRYSQQKYATLATHYPSITTTPPSNTSTTTTTSSSSPSSTHNSGLSSSTPPTPTFSSSPLTSLWSTSSPTIDSWKRMFIKPKATKVKEKNLEYIKVLKNLAEKRKINCIEIKRRRELLMLEMKSDISRFLQCSQSKLSKSYRSLCYTSFAELDITFEMEEFKFALLMGKYYELMSDETFLSFQVHLPTILIEISNHPTLVARRIHLRKLEEKKRLKYRTFVLARSKAVLSDRETKMRKIINKIASSTNNNNNNNNNNNSNTLSDGLDKERLEKEEKRSYTLTSHFTDLRYKEGRKIKALKEALYGEYGENKVPPGDISDFIEDMVIEMSEEYQSSETEIDVIRLHLSRTIFRKIFDYCWTYDEEEMSDYDKIFKARVKVLNTFSPFELDLELQKFFINESEESLRELFQPCWERLFDIVFEICPTDMLRILREVIRLATETTQRKTGQILSADDLFPIVVFIILNSSIDSIHKHLNYMNNFANEEERVSELGYCLTTFQAAVQHVLAMRPSPSALNPDLNPEQ